MLTNLIPKRVIVRCVSRGWMWINSWRGVLCQIQHTRSESELRDELVGISLALGWCWFVVLMLFLFA